MIHMVKDVNLQSDSSKTDILLITPPPFLDHFWRKQHVEWALRTGYANTDEKAVEGMMRTSKVMKTYVEACLAVGKEEGIDVLDIYLGMIRAAGSEDEDALRPFFTWVDLDSPRLIISEMAYILRRKDIKSCLTTSPSSLKASTLILTQRGCAVPCQTTLNLAPPRITTLRLTSLKRRISLHVARFHKSSLSYALLCDPNRPHTCQPGPSDQGVHGFGKHSCIERQSLRGLRVCSGEMRRESATWR